MDGRDGFLDPDIYAQHLLSDGTLDASWPASGRPVTTADGSQYVAGVVPDGQGGSIILWLDTSRFGTEGYVRGDLYAMRVDRDGSVHDGWNSAGAPVDTATVVYSGGYGLTADGLGGLFVAWEDQRTGTRDIRMQHVLENGQIPTGWPVDGIPVCTAIGDQWSPRLAPDGVGGVFVCWADYRGIGGPVYLQHIEASGLPDPEWPTDGMPVRRSGAPDYEGWHTILPDGAGGTFVAWLGGDGAGYNYELRAMRLRANGTLETGWPDTGVLLASGHGAYLGLTACHDGAGGIYLAWQDSHLSTDLNQQDVFIARVLANGTLPSGWSVGGRALCMKPGSQWTPRIAMDGMGGAYVAWADDSDFAETGSHVYGSHVQGSGDLVPGWPINGLLLSRSISSQTLCSLISDGNGGSLVIWGDYVYGAYDVMAQRLEAGGIATSAFQVVDTDVGSDHVRIRWQAPSGSGFTATVERYRDSQAWSELGPPTPLSDGILEYTDLAVEPGAQYFYRLLVLASDGVSGFYGTASVRIPLELRMRSPSPNPARNVPVFEVTLEAGGTARFDLFDISGRAIWSQNLSGAGVHEIQPSPPRKLASGLYIARLQAGQRVLKQRICILR